MYSIINVTTRNLKNHEVDLSNSVSRLLLVISNKYSKANESSLNLMYRHCTMN
jgi:hypothetical protein